MFTNDFNCNPNFQDAPTQTGKLLWIYVLLV